MDVSGRLAQRTAKAIELLECQDQVVTGEARNNAHLAFEDLYSLELSGVP